jgi:uncharacterized protein YceH (UPF0502 family)
MRDQSEQFGAAVADAETPEFAREVARRKIGTMSVIVGRFADELATVMAERDAFAALAAARANRLAAIEPELKSLKESVSDILSKAAPLAGPIVATEAVE